MRPRPAHPLQRTRSSRFGCNPRIPWAGSLGFGSLRRFARIHVFILGSAIMLLLFIGCVRPGQTPSAGFRLTLQDIATDSNVRAALLTIHTASEGFISVVEESGHSSTALPDPNAGGSREGSVALIASRIAPSGDGDIYIQTLIRPQTPNGSYAGGPSTYTLPRSTQLADHFAITAKSGDYPLDTPIEIARLKGRPVMLTVGKPTK
jgi:hypothetical protein